MVPKLLGWIPTFGKESTHMKNIRGPLLSATTLLFALGETLAAGTAELPGQKTVAIFGQRIAYYEAGSGPTVVLLHGLGSNAAADWGACIAPIAARHHVLAPDQLGFGASDKPMVDYGIQTWVDMLGEFI